MENNYVKPFIVFIIGFLLVLYVKPFTLTGEERQAYNTITCLYIVMSIYGTIIIRNINYFVNCG